MFACRTLPLATRPSHPILPLEQPEDPLLRSLLSIPASGPLCGLLSASSFADLWPLPWREHTEPGLLSGNAMVALTSAADSAAAIAVTAAARSQLKSSRDRWGGETMGKNLEKRQVGAVRSLVRKAVSPNHWIWHRETADVKG